MENEMINIPTKEYQMLLDCQSKIQDMITITLSEYKELLETKGKYDELKSNQYNHIITTPYKPSEPYYKVNCRTNKE